MSEWVVSEFDYEDVADAISITSPEGFVFEIRGRNMIPKAMAAMTAFGEEACFQDSTRVLIGQDGTLHLIDRDQWTNEKFFYGDKVGTASGLANALSTYLQGLL